MPLKLAATAVTLGCSTPDLVSATVLPSCSTPESATTSVILGYFVLPQSQLPHRLQGIEGTQRGQYPRRAAVEAGVTESEDMDGAFVTRGTEERRVRAEVDAVGYDGRGVRGAVSFLLTHCPESVSFRPAVPPSHKLPPRSGIPSQRLQASP